MSEVRDTPITSNRGGTNSPTHYSPDEDLQYAVETSCALKDKQSVLNNCSVRTLFNFLDWRGRTNS